MDDLEEKLGKRYNREEFSETGFKKSLYLRAKKDAVQSIIAQRKLTIGTNTLPSMSKDSASRKRRYDLPKIASKFTVSDKDKTNFLKHLSPRALENVRSISGNQPALTTDKSRLLERVTVIQPRYKKT